MATSSLSPTMNYARGLDPIRDPGRSRRRRGGGGGGFRGRGGGAGGGGSFLAPFTSKNEQAARNITVAALKKGGKQAQRILTRGERELKGDYAKGLQAVDTGVTTARGDIAGARDRAISRLDTAGEAGLGAIMGGAASGREAITTGRDAALAGLQPYAAAAAGAAPLYADATGLGGAAGSDRAIGAFREAPGYQYALKQGLDAINRTAAARGELGGGGNSTDLYDYAQGLSDKGWNDWLARLEAEQKFGAGIAQQMGGINTTAGGQLADIYGNEGASLANTGINVGSTGAGYLTDAGNTLGNTATWGAGSKLNTLGTLGKQKYDFATDLARLKYGTTTGTGAAQAGFQQSKNTTGGNIWGGIFGAGQLATSMFPKLGTGQQSANVINAAG